MASVQALLAVDNPSSGQFRVGPVMLVLGVVLALVVDLHPAIDSPCLVQKVLGVVLVLENLVVELHPAIDSPYLVQKVLGVVLENLVALVETRH